MKFNEARAIAAVAALMVLIGLVGVVCGLVVAWIHAPVLAVGLTAIIAVPLVAGFWPTKEKK